MTPFAIALVLLSAALHAIWSVVIKGSRDPVAFNALQMAVGGSVGLAIFASTPGVAALDSELWWVIAAAGLCHALYMYWMGRAFAAGDLSLVYPIARSTPAVLPFAAVPLLGERISVAGALGIATAVAGMWLVQTQGRLQISALTERAAGFAWLTLAATVGYGLTDKQAMVLLDAASWERGALPRAVFYFFASTLAGAIVLVPLVWMRAGARSLLDTARADGGKAVTAICFSLVSYALILEALRSAQASYVVTVRQSSVLFALALGVTWLGERPTRARVIGAALTATGVAIVVLAG